MDISDYQDDPRYHETKAHTKAEFPYNTYLCSIPLNFQQVPLHYHEELELIVIQEGTGTVSVDLHSETVSAGDMVLALPGQLHSIEQKETYSMAYENILLDPAMLTFGPQDLCRTQYIGPLMDRTMMADTFLTPRLPYYAELSRCIRAIDRLQDLRPDGYQLAVRGWLLLFFYQLVLNKKTRDPASSAKAKSLDKLKTLSKYVEKHYAEPISISDMAELTHYSKSHFMRFFKNCMGQSFTEYLNNYRLSMAARALASTDAGILEIAQQSGFENLSYFNRLFRKKFGKTPRQYRTSQE